MEKKIRKAVKYENLTPELMKEVMKKYPSGFEDHLIKVNGPSNTFFYAFMLDLPDASYLIKVDVKIDNSYEDESDDFDNEESIGREDDNFASNDSDSDDEDKVKPSKPIDDDDEEDDDEEDDDEEDDDDLEEDDAEDVDEKPSKGKGKTKAKPKAKPAKPALKKSKK